MTSTTGEGSRVERSSSGQPLLRARRSAAWVATATLVAVAVTGAALTWRYMPDGGGPGHLVSPAARWSRQLARWHEGSMLVAAVVLVGWGGLVAWDPHVPRHRRRIGIGVAAVAVALTALTARSWQQVQWDQLGLRAVTVGGSYEGLWFAAFSDEVRFLLVSGRGEVSQAGVAAWVVAHLLAPALALALVVVGWVAVEPSRGPRRRIVAITDDSDR